MHQLIICRDKEYKAQLIQYVKGSNTLKERSSILINQGWKLIHSVFNEHFVIYIMEK